MSGPNSPPIELAGVVTSSPTQVNLSWAPGNFTVSTYTTNGTWTNDLGALSVDGIVIAGGGGGAAGELQTSGTPQPGNGGGGGEIGLFTGASPSLFTSTVAIIVGAAGTGAPDTTMNGVAGGNSSFGAYVAVNGGQGGVNAASGANHTPGGTGGTTTIGAALTDGGDGGGGQTGAPTPNTTIAPSGGGVGGNGNGSGGSEINGIAGGNVGSLALGGLGGLGQFNNIIGNPTPLVGQSGGNGSAPSAGYAGSGGGGGGAAIDAQFGASTTSGAGGRGGNYGSGGGGGGVAGGGTITAGGAGGNGAQGIVVITQHYAPEDSFNVYRDGVLLTNTTSNSFIDATPLFGDITYSVTALYGGFESAPDTIVVPVGTPVPNLLGGNQAEAVLLLTAAGLALGGISFQYNPNIARGTIFAQDPAPSTLVQFGSLVSITISLGATAVVPDVLGMTVSDATTTLAQFGLTLGAVGSAYDGSTPLGDVIIQNPTPGTLVQLPASVNVDLSAFVPEFDIEQTVISQYQNSTTIQALVEDFAEYFDPTANVTAFYNNVWNINTAIGFGLDIWGRILGVSRVVPNPSTQGVFGFENSNRPFDWQNWGNAAGTSGGPFFSGQNSNNSFKLNDSSYRTLLLTKALANICTTTAPALNALVSNLFPGRGACYTQDLGAMEMQYTFKFALTNIEFAILSYSGVLPHPAGVGVSVVVSP